MPQTIDRGGARPPVVNPPRRRNGGIVLLATYDDAPYERDAARVAVESAAEMRSRLVLADLYRRPRHATRATPAAQVAARGRVEALAGEFGVPVERVVLTGRPDAALATLVDERRPALVVLAADPPALRRLRRPRWRWRGRLIRVLAEHADCLSWVAQDTVFAGAASSAAIPSSRARPAPMRRARPGSAITMTSPTSSQIATTIGKRS
jgi:hypothetical protein